MINYTDCLQCIQSTTERDYGPVLVSHGIESPTFVAVIRKHMFFVYVNHWYVRS